MNWTLKIAAFLSKSPACALLPKKGDDPLARRLIQAACGRDATEGLMEEAFAIQRIASGMDIPPFIEKLDGSCFLRNPVVTHPLSGQEWKLELPPRLANEKVASHVEDTLKRIVRDVGSEDRKKLFFFLWRRFSDALVENDETGLKGLWNNLPADGRIPSHTIWEHAAVSSAVAGAWPKPAILVFTIASAQDMVATARRTQDAWMGSFLLSYLTWQAMRVIAEECGPDAVISPSLKGQPLVDRWLHKDLKLETVPLPDKNLLEIGNIPNLFTAIVPFEKAMKLAEDCEKTVQGAWEKIAGKVKEAVEGAHRAASTPDRPSWWDDWNKIWNRQRSNFMHNQGIYWVICPWGTDYNSVITAKKIGGREPDELKELEDVLERMRNNGSDPHIGMVYHLLSSFAGTELTARKNLRNFRQTDEAGHKCSLCGKWEALHPSFSPEAAGYSALRRFWDALSVIDRTNDTIKLAGRIRRGEMLCSICLTRRLALEAFFKDDLGLDHHMFPSTAGISTAAFRGRILEKCGESTDLKDAVEDYVRELEPFIEGRFPYPSASTDRLDDCGDVSGLKDKGAAFLRIDGGWLFRGAYERIRRGEDRGLTEEEIKSCNLCSDAAGKLVRVAKEKGLGDLPGYYAILAMDGDHMGDWVTGAKNHAPLYRWLFHPDLRRDPSITHMIARAHFRRPMGPAMQLALSDSLKNFSLAFARDIIEKEHAGKLVYAGGDDLLAFLPLEHLLPAMSSLHSCFRGTKGGHETKEPEILRLAGGVRKDDGEECPHEGVTASMGAVIVHHSHPLYHAMQEAQKVLKDTAKKQLGRDAFAIRLLRRAGESTEGGSKFNALIESRECDIIKLLNAVLGRIQGDELSGRLPTTMGMHLWAAGSDPELGPAQRTELARIVARHTKSSLQDADKIRIKQDVLSLFDAVQRNHDNLNPWDMTARLLFILRFMAGKE